MQTGNEGFEQTEDGGSIQTEPLLEAQETEYESDAGGIEDGQEELDIEPLQGESARETARRVFEQQGDETDSEDKGNEGQEKRLRGADGKFIKKEAEGTAEQPVQQKAEQASGEVPPPAAWTAAEKEAFKKADPKIKAAIDRREKELQSHATKRYEEVSKKEKEVDHIVQSVRPYLMQHPEVMEAGYTEATFISALVGAHKALQNPETKYQKWLDIGAEVGIDGETIAELKDIIMGDSDGSMSRQNMDIRNHPDYIALQNRLQPLESQYQQQTEQQRQAAISEFTSRIQAVMDETDQQGSYIYPRAHDPGFVNQVRPLMSALLANEPNITPEAAFKQSYVALYGLPQRQPQARPTTQNFQNNNNFNQRASSAAVSVRGKTPSATGQSPVDDVPKEVLKNARETARWAFSQNK